MVQHTMSLHEILAAAPWSKIVYGIEELNNIHFKELLNGIRTDNVAKMLYLLREYEENQKNVPRELKRKGRPELLFLTEEGTGKSAWDVANEKKNENTLAIMLMGYAQLMNELLIDGAKYNNWFQFDLFLKSRIPDICFIAVRGDFLGKKARQVALENNLDMLAEHFAEYENQFRQRFSQLMQKA